MDKTRIILVDDKSSYRNTTKLLLRKIGNNEVVGEASNGIEFLELIDKIDADLVFMDIEMPGMNGIEATKLALEKKPNLKIIGLSLYDDSNYIDNLINAGASGYLLKLSDNYSIIEAIIKYRSAEIFFSPEIDPEKDKKESKQKKILLVDDFENTRFVIEYTLEAEGFEVVSYDKPKQALKEINSHKYDLILVDYNMPQMNGVAFSKKLREIEDFKQTPILLLTTDKSKRTINRAIKAGINDWIFKPFRVDLFLDKINSILSN